MSEEFVIGDDDRQMLEKRLRLLTTYIEKEKVEQERRNVQRVAKSNKGDNDRVNENTDKDVLAQNCNDNKHGSDNRG